MLDSFLFLDSFCHAENILKSFYLQLELYLRQFSSSDRSTQSISPSHRHTLEMQSPLLHCHLSAEHVGSVGKTSQPFSSSPLGWQSSLPSQRHFMGRHWRPHWNSWPAQVAFTKEEDGDEWEVILFDFEKLNQDSSLSARILTDQGSQKSALTNRTVFFIGAIETITVTIAFPGLADTWTIFARELVCLARLWFFSVT